MAVDLPAPGEIRRSPDDGALADYTPRSARDVTPWTVRTFDNRFVMRVVPEAVQDWPVVGHLDHALQEVAARPAAAPGVEAGRVITTAEEVPEDLDAVLDASGTLWTAQDWAYIGLDDLLAASGPLLEVPLRHLRRRLNTARRS